MLNFTQRSKKTHHSASESHGLELLIAFIVSLVSSSKRSFFIEAFLTTS
jgi:hypothetical protein